MTRLEDVATAADAVADEQRTVARAARSMQRARARGASWSSILDREHASGVVQLLRRSARRLRDASTGFTSLLARGLAEEGASRRAIAKRLGVSHQRITSMLRADGGSPVADE